MTLAARWRAAAPAEAPTTIHEPRIVSTTSADRQESRRPELPRTGARRGNPAKSLLFLLRCIGSRPVGLNGVTMRLAMHTRGPLPCLLAVFAVCIFQASSLSQTLPDWTQPASRNFPLVGGNLGNQ